MKATLVSVIIPSAGQAPSLQRCLDSLRPQALEGGIEVVVALDGGVAMQAAAIQQLRARSDWPWPLRWVDLDTRCGPAVPRNRAAAEAHGRYFIFLDDDMIADPDFVAAHLELLAQNLGAATVGAIKTRCDGYSGAYGYSIEKFWDARHDRLTREPNMSFRDCFGGNLSMAREVFQRIGGFDESIPACEDLEFGLRLARADVRLLYGPRALSVQLHRKAPSDMMRDCEVRGLAYVRLWRSYPEARRTITFARRRTRWLTRLALSTRWRCESLAFILPWLPATHLTYFFYMFLCEVAEARGARREFADADQWTALTEGSN